MGALLVVGFSSGASSFASTVNVHEGLFFLLSCSAAAGESVRLVAVP